MILKKLDLQVESQNNAFGSLKNDVCSIFFPKWECALMAKWKTLQRQTPLLQYIELVMCVLSI